VSGRLFPGDAGSNVIWHILQPNFLNCAQLLVSPLFFFSSLLAWRLPFSSFRPNPRPRALVPGASPPLLFAIHHLLFSSPSSDRLTGHHRRTATATCNPKPRNPRPLPHCLFSLPPAASGSALLFALGSPVITGAQPRQGGNPQSAAVICYSVGKSATCNPSSPPQT